MKLEPIFQCLAIVFGALFTAKIIWLAYMAYKNRLPDPDKGEVSGWGVPDDQ